MQNTTSCEPCLFLDPMVTVFRSGEKVILRTPFLTLNFFDKKMGNLLVFITKTFSHGSTENDAIINTKANLNSDIAYIEKIIEVLKKYNLLLPNKEKATGNCKKFVFFTLGDFPYLEKSLLNNYPCVSDTNKEKLLHSIVEQQKSGIIPVVFAENYMRDFFLTINKTLLERKADWILLFHFFDSIYVFPFIHKASPCFNCLPPLSESGHSVDSIEVVINSNTDELAISETSSLIRRVLHNFEHQENAIFRFAEQLSLTSGVHEQTRRFHDPWCQVCSGESTK